MPNITVAEEWRPVTIPGFESIYSVSSLGRIRRDTDTSRGKAGKILTPKRVRKYHQVLLRNGKYLNRYCYVHQVVAMAFRGPPPGRLGRNIGTWQTDHIDKNPHNNAASNLRWITMRENRAQAVMSGKGYLKRKRNSLGHFAESLSIRKPSPFPTCPKDTPETQRASSLPE